MFVLTSTTHCKLILRIVNAARYLTLFCRSKNHQDAVFETRLLQVQPSHRKRNETRLSRQISILHVFCVEQFRSVCKSRGNARGTPCSRKRSWRPCRVCSRMGVARRRRDHLSTKVRPHVRNRRGWRVVHRPCSFERSTLGVSTVLSRTHSPLPPISGPPSRKIGRSRIRGCSRGRRRRGSAYGTRRGEHGGENQNSRVAHRDISLGRTRARPCRRYRTAACRLEILSIPRRPSSLTGSRSRKVTRRTPNDRPGVPPSEPIDKSTRTAGTERARSDRRAACEYMWYNTGLERDAFPEETANEIPGKNAKVLREDAASTRDVDCENHEAPELAFQAVPTNE